MTSVCLESVVDDQDAFIYDCNGIGEAGERMQSRPTPGKSLRCLGPTNHIRLPPNSFANGVQHGVEGKRDVGSYSTSLIAPHPDLSHKPVTLLRTWCSLGLGIKHPCPRMTGTHFPQHNTIYAVTCQHVVCFKVHDRLHRCRSAGLRRPWTKKGF